jgi:oligoribonuclease
MGTATLAWVDLEMTGLDPDRCAIVEIATLVTDDQLDIVAEGPNLVVHQPEPVLAAMSREVREMHRRSGLLRAIRDSTLSLADAAEQTLAFLKEHLEPGKAPLCGNSVWKDRSFLERYAPELAQFFHYRNVDVSTLKELARRWYGPAGRCPEKAESHRALDDIRESIAELRWYRGQVFLAAPPAP